MQIFIDDDDGYLRWLAEHPAGYVVNSYRRPCSTYLVLHRASCPHISTAARTNWTTTGYIKICAAHRERLATWARQETGEGPKGCGVCKP
jgi:hypothetical protein